MLTTPPPQLQFSSADSVVLSGDWRAQQLSDAELMPQIARALQDCQGRSLDWDLRQLTALDHIGAMLLWRSWGKQMPQQIQLLEAHHGLFQRLQECAARTIPPKPRERLTRIMRLGMLTLGALGHVLGIIELLGQLMLDLCKFARHPLRGPWREISANIYRAGFQALAITALVGILIGIVLSFLSAQQLRTFGGDVYLVNILGMSIIRELGPMLAAILVAGRSGSAMTAQLGVMRVTEEIDAMRVMGIPVGFRLIMPKVVALAIAMPLIVIWTDAMALIGGMLSAHQRLGMSPQFFLQRLPEAVPLLNYWIGLAKGVVFGVLIALMACHFGLRIKPNTESLGQGTTQSVVISITIVIIADAIFAIIFSKSGY